MGRWACPEIEYTCVYRMPQKDPKGHSKWDKSWATLRNLVHPIYCYGGQTIGNDSARDGASGKNVTSDMRRESAAQVYTTLYR